MQETTLSDNFPGCPTVVHNPDMHNKVCIEITSLQCPLWYTKMFKHNYCFIFNTILTILWWESHFTDKISAYMWHVLAVSAIRVEGPLSWHTSCHICDHMRSNCIIVQNTCGSNVSWCSDYYSIGATKTLKLTWRTMLSRSKQIKVSYWDT